MNEKPVDVLSWYHLRQPHEAALSRGENVEVPVTVPCFARLLDDISAMRSGVPWGVRQRAARTGRFRWWLYEGGSVTIIRTEVKP